jgi:hypothetical protein
MNIFYRSKLAFTTVIVAFDFLFFPLQYAKATSSSPKPSRPPCRIDIDNAHISKTVFQHHGVTVVIVKARSVCNVLQQQVLLTVEISKTELLGARLIATSKTKPLTPTSSGLIVFNNGTTKVCKTNALTHYYGIAYSKALINGKWLYAGRTQSPKTVPVLCGT